MTLLPENVSVLGLQECAALPSYFQNSHLCILSFLLSSFTYLFSSLHNLYKYCNILMFFLNFTSITCSLSPSTYFWWKHMPVYVFACPCMYMFMEVRGQPPLSVLSFLPPLWLTQAFLRPGALQVESVSTILGLQVCPAFCMDSGEMNSDPCACKLLYN